MAMQIPDNAIEVLQKARARIANKGWIQNHYYNNDGFCAVGAIQGELGFDRTPPWGKSINDFPQQFYNEIKEALKKVLGIDIVVYNDEPGRTKEEILKAFDDTIDYLKGAKNGQADTD